ncbi:MAG: hypothetical protein LM580_05185 [Thermofilum sp.]|nr:hypothetical protein [Thermofilum sp.]
MKLAGRILLLFVTLLARLTGLDELLDAIVLSLMLIEEWRRSVVRKSILRSSDLVTRDSEQ